MLRHLCDRLQYSPVGYLLRSRQQTHIYINMRMCDLEADRNICCKKNETWSKDRLAAIIASQIFNKKKVWRTISQRRESHEWFFKSNFQYCRFFSSFYSFSNPLSSQSVLFSDIFTRLYSFALHKIGSWIAKLLWFFASFFSASARYSQSFIWLAGWLPQTL